jgi:AraC-like DNA-binding protein
MMITQKITTLSSVAALLAQTLRSLGYDPEPLFVKAGIAPDDVGNPAKRILTTRMQALWRLALDVTGDPALGLVVARQFQPAVLHGLGLACLASDTLHDVLRRLVRYARIVNELPDFQLEEPESTIDLVVKLPELDPDFVHASMDLGMAAFLRMCQITAGHDILPVRTCLQRPTPADTIAYKLVFGPDIEFEADSNRLCLDRTAALAPLSTAHPELARLNDQTVIDYLARHDRNNITMQVRSRIIEQLPDGRPSQGEIAIKLNTSLRSLQRKLHQQDTSFKELLNDTQRELALSYIRDSNRSIGEITYLLGFSEPSNFTRAFKRWTGKSPGEYRDNRS